MMKNNDQGGFILMIVIMVAIAIAIIGFAVHRIMNANSTVEAYNSSSTFVLEYESTKI